MPNKTYIIAEAGVNHNGDVELAKKLIVEAKKTGADAVKFQTFKTDLLSHPGAKQAEYQMRECGDTGQHAMLKKLELPQEAFIELKQFADQQGITFLSTPFDLDSLDFLLSLHLPVLKVSSGDLDNGPLLLRIAQANKKVIISTGMSTMDEIKSALAVLAFGYLRPDVTPNSFAEIQQFALSVDIPSALADKVIILHCTSDYPAKNDQINLNVLKTLREEFKLPIGYSDHSLGILVPSLAVGLGAVLIEKHFTLDNNMDGPDHKASLNPQDFTAMVQQIRLVETLLGSSIKAPTIAEQATRLVARKGVYIAKPVKAGQIITQDDLICMRPVAETSPMQFWDLLNSPAKQDYEEFDACKL